MTSIFKLFGWLTLIFILPSLIHLGIWSFKGRPASWRHADWTSANILPQPTAGSEGIFVLVARTGGLKGAFATHSWIVTKKMGDAHFDRYDVVGWGKPVRKNAYPADGRWYSNAPRIHYHIGGAAARRAIPKLEAAIKNYEWQKRGDYTLWPGPNSNTFVATVLRSAPELEVAMPATAIGRDYTALKDWIITPKAGAWRASLAGYAGIVIGKQEGIEINFLGLVAGINLSSKEVKIPAFGTFSFSGII